MGPAGERRLTPAEDHPAPPHEPLPPRLHLTSILLISVVSVASFSNNLDGKLVFDDQAVLKAHQHRVQRWLTATLALDHLYLST